jgi:hypothetical protein
VFNALLCNHLIDQAVFKAFKAVEIGVRAAGGYASADIGVPLMRKALQADTGPLTRLSDPAAERQALSDLSAGLWHAAARLLDCQWLLVGATAISSVFAAAHAWLASLTFRRSGVS